MGLGLGLGLELGLGLGLGLGLELELGLELGLAAARTSAGRCVRCGGHAMRCTSIPAQRGGREGGREARMRWWVTAVAAVAPTRQGRSLSPGLGWQPLGRGGLPPYPYPYPYPYP